LKILEKLAHFNPKNMPLQRDLALSYSVLGDIFYREKNDSKALEYYKKSLSIGLVDNSIFINYYELNLIHRISINKKFEDYYISLFKNNKNKFIAYEILRMIKDVTEHKKIDFLKWKTKYKNVSTNFDFTMLEEWSRTINDKDIKTKIINLLKKLNMR